MRHAHLSVRTATVAIGMLLALGASGCDDDTAEPYVPPIPIYTRDAPAPIEPDDEYRPTEPDQELEPAEPDTDPCAFAGDPLCPDAPIYVPPPHLPDW